MPTVLALGDETALSALQDVLEPFGHGLVSVASASSLVDAARTGTYALILCDIDRDDGSGLVQKLLGSWDHSRVVAITSYLKAPTAVQALQEGAHCLMKKPFEIDRILRLLAETQA